MFFVIDRPTTEIYALSLHDALPFCDARAGILVRDESQPGLPAPGVADLAVAGIDEEPIQPRLETTRSEEHTSELQSHQYLVCRLLLDKKTNTRKYTCLTACYATIDY